jgi:hypothetical protein
MYPKRVNISVFQILFLAILAGLSACSKLDDPKDYHEYLYDFSEDNQGWFATFSDYPVADADFYELSCTHSPLPAPLDVQKKGLKLSGNNHSDDLLALIFNEVDNLFPNTTYEVTFEITLASNVATNSVGIGGSPDLALGVGGLPYLPGDSIDASGWSRPNFESRLQSFESSDVMQMIGTIGVNDSTTNYTLIHRNNLDSPLSLTTDAYGHLFFMVGYDSGFEGITTLYFTSITVKLKYEGK